MGSVGEAGVVATAVAAAIDNEGSQIEGRVISPSERGNRGKERSGWRHERGETEDERDLNGKRGEEGYSWDVGRKRERKGGRQEEGKGR